jgi:hypothetical protein
VIIVDGKPLPEGGPDGRELALLELRLYKALAALDPPHGLAAILHSRIAARIRELRHTGTPDPGTRHPADLTPDELHEAAGITRVLLALPGHEHATMGGHGLQVALTAYARDLASEARSRATHPPPPP